MTGFDAITAEGNVLFNDTLNTFYLRLYGISYYNRRQIPEETSSALTFKIVIII